MTAILKTGVLYVTTPECYDRYFVDFDFFHGPCMKATLSKLVGLAIVLGSLTVKVPQILKIIQNKSGEGISLTGNIFELSACTSFFAYSYLKQFPFSAWGDGLFLAIQTVAVIGLIFHYKNESTQAILFSLSYIVLMFLTVSGTIPLSFFWLMQILNFPLIILGKGAQIMTNYRNRSTGQLSAITCWMQFGGALARVFTSMQETGDAAIILIFIVATILNGAVVFQILFYGSADEKNTKGKGKDQRSPPNTIGHYRLQTVRVYKADLGQSLDSLKPPPPRGRLPPGHCQDSVHQTSWRQPLQVSKPSKYRSLDAEKQRLDLKLLADSRITTSIQSEIPHFGGFYPRSKSSG